MKKKKRGAKGNFLKRNYLLSWDYIKESKNFIYLSILIFAISAIIGFLFPVFFSEEIMGLVNDLIEKTQNYNQYELIRFIFFNNLQSSFMGLIVGIFFGVFPVLMAIMNGYILGFISSASINEAGFSVLLKLVPHGIFELPAIFISLGMGIKFGTFLFHKKRKKDLKHYFINSVRVFLSIVIPLLIIAAIIEGTLIVLFG